MTFAVQVVFEQQGYWSKPYDYLSSTSCKDKDVVVPARTYMAVARVISERVATPEDLKKELKYVYGLVHFEFILGNNADGS